MKFMGSKRWMLQNGLGSLLIARTARAARFLDLFSGSGAVACYVAQNQNVPVFAFDLQYFSSALTGAVVARRAVLSTERIWTVWLRRSQQMFEDRRPPDQVEITPSSVEVCREWSSEQLDLPVTRAYGGHYFSPKQSVWIDSLRFALPNQEPVRTVALAALIHAASQCAAAPGHTAQPFQPTRTAKGYLAEAWGKDVVERTRNTLAVIARQCAKRVGKAEVGDANEAARHLRDGDVAFIDPPYSGVHYSRFYHVLETIARGQCGEVSGVGRYPDPTLRPKSRYSRKRESARAFEDLLQTVATNGAKAIVTFPDHECSNGLSGVFLRETARKYFRVVEKVVESKFSTLGGNHRVSKTGNERSPKQHARELILVLTPK